MTERNKRSSKIPKSKRFTNSQKMDFSPGPKYGRKDMGRESSHRNLPKISFSKEKRFSRKKDIMDGNSPDPGHYDIKSPKARNVKPIKADICTSDVLEAYRISKLMGPGPESYMPNVKKY